MLWDLDNKRGRKGEAPTAYYSFARAKPSPSIIVSQGSKTLTVYYTTKIENILKTTK